QRCYERAQSLRRAEAAQLWKNIDARFDSRLDEAMKPKLLFVCGCVFLLSFTFASPAAAADTKIEQALRDLDAKWSAGREPRTSIRQSLITPLTLLSCLQMLRGQ